MIAGAGYLNIAGVPIIEDASHMLPGALNIGPMSAGSEPGPVAYNNGGKEPTLTDSNLVMGIMVYDCTSL